MRWPRRSRSKGRDVVTMDSAARAIDAMLHRGRAEERDGGVWLDDLGASELGSDTVDEYGVPWRKVAEEWEEEARRIEGEREAIIEDRELATDALLDIMRMVGIPTNPDHERRPLPGKEDALIERIRERLEEWRDE